MTELDNLLSRQSQSCISSVPQIDVTSLAALISRLKPKKAAGVDGIVSEHITYAGLDLVVHLCLLFNALLRHSFVPSDFCKGIIIPLLKTDMAMQLLDMYYDLEELRSRRWCRHYLKWFWRVYLRSF